MPRSGRRHRQRPVELHHQDVGAGHPVVLILGWPLSGRSGEVQVGTLVAAGHRAVTYDRRGFGDSSQPWNGDDDDTVTADLHPLLEHLDLRDHLTCVTSRSPGSRWAVGEVVPTSPPTAPTGSAARRRRPAVPPHLSSQTSCARMPP